MGNTLALELTEETFAGCVIATVLDGTHAADQRVAGQKTLIVRTGELAAESFVSDCGVIASRKA